jgi:hypothetical protein
VTYKLIVTDISGTITETPFDTKTAAVAAAKATPHSKDVNDLIKVKDSKGLTIFMWGTEKGYANDPEMQEAHAEGEATDKLAESIGMKHAVIAMHGVTEPRHLDRVVSQGPKTTVRGRSFAPFTLDGVVTLRDVFLGVDKALGEAGPQDAIFIELVTPRKVRDGEVLIGVFMGS